MKFHEQKKYIRKKNAFGLHTFASKSKTIGMKEISFTIDIKKSKLPFITITEGDFKGFNFLVDTGCTQSVIFSFAIVNHLNFIKTNGKYGAIVGLNGCSKETLKIKARMVFAGIEINVPFDLLDDSLSSSSVEKSIGICMHGIIGNDFMISNGWIIDLANQKIIINKLMKKVA